MYQKELKSHRAESSIQVHCESNRQEPSQVEKFMKKNSSSKEQVKKMKESLEMFIVTSKYLHIIIES